MSSRHYSSWPSKALSAWITPRQHSVFTGWVSHGSASTQLLFLRQAQNIITIKELGFAVIPFKITIKKRRIQQKSKINAE